MKRIIRSLLLLVFMAGAAVAATRNAQVTAKSGMVASAHALASQAGLEMLKAGGNAVDAAVAAAFALGVCEPNASGLGGEGMIVIYRADRKVAGAIDYRSTAPAAAAYPEGVPQTGHASVAVPGTVAGLTLALRRHGSMKLAFVLGPAIRIAKEGFVVSPTLASSIVEHFDGIMKNPTMAALFCPEGLPLEAGAKLKNPALAESLRKISAGGPDVFYRGELAEAIAQEMAMHGGFVSKADLAAYRAIEREPVRGSYRGYDLISAPPPVGGLSVIQILQMLEHFPLAENAPLAPINVHRMAEAMRRGFADFAAYVADPDFAKVPVAGLLSPDYARRRAAEIRDDQRSQKVEAGEPEGRQSASTTALAVADRRGNMVALTQTISDLFGSNVMVPGTGIILNNEMKNFSARGVNALAPGKRMRTNIAPTIITRGGRTFAVLGTPGAARITSTMVILISNLIDHRMGIQEAIEAPRFFARDREELMSVEARVPEETLKRLAAMGYKFERRDEFDLFFGGAQGIVIDPKTQLLMGGADPRRDGAVLGY